jgi:hypothetical protein
MTKKTMKKTVNPAKKMTAKKTTTKKTAAETKKAVGKCDGGCKCSRSRKAKARA